MNLLIRIISLILILLTFLIALIGGLYILVVEIDYILDVDVIWKLKQKVRAIVYGEQRGIYKQRDTRNRRTSSKVYRIKR